MSTAHLRACIFLADNSLKSLPDGRGMFTRAEVQDMLLDLRNAFQSAYVIELLELQPPVPPRWRRSWLEDQSG